MVWGFAPSEALCIAVGIGAAFLFVFVGYGPESKSQSYSDAPRVKNFTAMLALGAAAFIADWPHVAAASDRLTLTAYYEITAVAMTLVFIAAVCILIALNVWRRNTSRPVREHMGTIPLVLEFLAGGFTGYRRLLAEHERNVIEGRLERSGSTSELMRSLNALMVAQQAHQTELRSLAPNASVQRAVLIDQVLSGVITACLAQMPTGQGSNLTANYMRAISAQNASATELGKVHFCEPPFTGISAILVLERYAYGPYTPGFAIPVHTDPNIRLPGAAAAFGDGKPRCVVTRSPFPKRCAIPNETKGRVVRYFKDRQFRSFLSIPMMRGAEIVGVMNVESDDEVFDPRDELITHLGESLHPYCTILANVIE